MSDPFLGQVIMFGGNFAPRGWAFCDGSLLAINSNQALYSILGTTYGGDGRTTFGLPDLRGRTPVHEGQGTGLSNVPLGQKGGEETHSLNVNEMPPHGHVGQASTDTGTSGSPAGKVLATMSDAGQDIYGAAANLTAMNDAAVDNGGGGQGHNNMQPYLAVNFIIALQGTFPSRN